MGQFKFNNTGIDGLILIDPTVYGDHRGFFMETWNQADFLGAGIDVSFVQDNQSGSTQGVLRGMHYQINNPQGKLVRVIAGEVYDVAVDIRYGSPTFGQWRGFVLSAENRLMLYVPEGFAHGFYVQSSWAEFTYKCTRAYDPADEFGLAWNDPDIGIDWRLSGEITTSEKDSAYPYLRDIPRDKLPQV